MVAEDFRLIGVVGQQDGNGQGGAGGGAGDNHTGGADGSGGGGAIPSDPEAAQLAVNGRLFRMTWSAGALVINREVVEYGLGDESIGPIAAQLQQYEQVWCWCCVGEVWLVGWYDRLIGSVG